MSKTLAAWTNAWLQQLPYRKLQQFIKWSRENPQAVGIAKVRARRLEAEWDRRKGKPRQAT